LVSVLSQINPVHIITPYFSKIYFNVISHLHLSVPSGLLPPDTWRSEQWSQRCPLLSNGSVNTFQWQSQQLLSCIPLRSMRQKNIVMSPAGPRTKNDCAGEGEKLLTLPTYQVRVSDQALRPAAMYWTDQPSHSIDSESYVKSCSQWLVMSLKAEECPVLEATTKQWLVKT
jgi:hypothetical protein